MGWSLRCLLAVCALAAAGSSAWAGDEASPAPPARPTTFPDLPTLPDVPPPSLSGGGAAQRFPDSRRVYLPLLHAEAKARGLPPDIADAVARIESGYNSTAVGGDGERGMMQVMPPTAAMLGFKGTTAELALPENNIRLGVAYLAGAWKRAGGDVCRTLMKYRAGHNEERMSPLSVEYCRRAKGHLAAIGSPFGAGAVPLPDLGPAVAPRGGDAGTFSEVARVRRIGGRLMRVAPVRTVATSRRFWSAHVARVRAIEARLPWKRGGILART